jgi:hypothetical protein
VINHDGPLVPSAFDFHLPKLETTTKSSILKKSKFVIIMKLLSAALLAGSAAAFAPVGVNNQRSATTQLFESQEDLAALAKKCNPILGFFDPLGLATQDFWGASNEATIGFIRESEIK